MLFLDPATPEIEAGINPATAGFQLSRGIPDSSAKQRAGILVLQELLQALQLIASREADIRIQQPDPTSITPLLESIKGCITASSKAPPLTTQNQVQRHRTEYRP